MANRKQRAALAKETLAIIESGGYDLPDGSYVDIEKAIGTAIAGTIHYEPESFSEVVRQRDQILSESRSQMTKFQVLNATTFAAARTLTDRSQTSERLAYGDTMCLNFASAKNPGGGFLSGSQAQEECLARASVLYSCINPILGYYETNRACGTSLYTDHMIYSPAVPVFRNDYDELIADPWRTSIVTAPAVNLGALLANQPEQAGLVETTMLGRIEKVLSLAVVHRCGSIVLGAWGCGVFGNEPPTMAKWFHQHLGPLGRFHNAFEHVAFAVLDRTDERRFIRPFQGRFQSLLSEKGDCDV